jgi:cell division protein FtsB
MEYVMTAVLTLVGYLVGSRRRNLRNDKLEFEVMEKGIQVWAKLTEELTVQVENLKTEIEDLKKENLQLRLEVQKLQTIILTYKN